MPPSTVVVTETLTTKAVAQKPPSELWRIHGRYYDLAPFVSTHPGGHDMIVLGKGRNATDLFESTHILSNQQAIQAVLKKHYVRDCTPEELKGTPRHPAGEALFSWKQDGFYHTVARRVRAHFQLKENSVSNVYKATYAYWLKMTVTLCVFFWSLQSAILDGNRFSALVVGLAMGSLNSCAMHDGSHGAISKRSWINRLANMFGTFLMWHHWIWLRHHTLSHHSMTGLSGEDPDMVHARPFINKSSRRLKPFQLYQKYYAWIILTVFPNQHWGQVLMYFLAYFTRSIFGIRLEKMPRSDFWLGVAVQCSSLFFNLVLLFMLHPAAQAFQVFLLMWSTLGFLYFVVVTPNHDTLPTHETLKEHEKKNETTHQLADWGEHQVRASGNHTVGNSLWAHFVFQMYGGMNYQIEHHLFPSVSHVHYRSIAPIVRKTCEEFGVKYNADQSWFGAMCSYFNFLNTLNVDFLEAQPKKAL